MTETLINELEKMVAECNRVDEYCDNCSYKPVCHVIYFGGAFVKDLDFRAEVE